MKKGQKGVKGVKVSTLERVVEEVTRMLRNPEIERLEIEKHGKQIRRSYRTRGYEV